MALFHDATISPTKAEMLAGWVPSQPWCPRSDGPIEVVGAFRFDDPEGRVGLETHLVMQGDTLLQVPLTYRDAPMEGGQEAFIGEMQHSALGTRCVYDGLGDQRYLIMLAAVAMTGQGESIGMVVYDERWFVAPTNVRIRGGGWTQERVPVDGFEPIATNAGEAVFGNDRFDMTVHRCPVPGEQPAIGLTATWGGHPGSVVLAEVRER